VAGYRGPDLFRRRSITRMTQLSGGLSRRITCWPTKPCCGLCRANPHAHFRPIWKPRGRCRNAAAPRRPDSRHSLAPLGLAERRPGAVLGLLHSSALAGAIAIRPAACRSHPSCRLGRLPPNCRPMSPNKQTQRWCHAAPGTHVIQIASAKEAAGRRIIGSLDAATRNRLRVLHDGVGAPA